MQGLNQYIKQPEKILDSLSFTIDVYHKVLEVIKHDLSLFKYRNIINMNIRHCKIKLDVAK